MMGLGKLSGRQDRRLTVRIAQQNDDFVSFRIASRGKCVVKQRNEAHHNRKRQRLD